MLQWTWACRYLFNILISFHFDIYPRVRLLDHVVIIFLIFGGTSILFFIIATLIYIPITGDNSSLFPTSSPTLFSSWLFESSHSNRCEVISHCSFICIATRSSVLAWRIPGTAEPGGLPSMGSHRVGHDWSDAAAAAAAQHN